MSLPAAPSAPVKAKVAMAGSTNVASSPAYQALHANVGKIVAHVLAHGNPAPVGQNRAGLAINGTQNTRAVVANNQTLSGVRSKPKAPTGPFTTDLFTGKPVPASATTKAKSIDPGFAASSTATRAIQTLLNRQGYHLSVDGQYGPLTAAAYHQYKVTGKGPQQPSPAIVGRAKANVSTTQHPQGFTSPSKSNPVKIAKTKATQAGVGTTTNGNGSLASASSASAAAGAIGSLIDPTTADSIAGSQYDPIINDLLTQQTRLPRQLAQDLADIGNWYGQVHTSLGNAKTADAAGALAGQGSMTDATKAIIASLGGSDNAGSTSVGYVGDNAVNTSKAIEQAQSDYQSNMSPILDLAESGAKSSEKARMVQAAQDIASQIGQAKGSRGQAKAAALMQILQANNATKQQNWANQFGIAQAIAAQNIANQSAQQQSQNSGVANWLKVLQGNKIINGINNPKPAKGSFASMGASDKNKLNQQVVSQLIDPTTGKLRAQYAGNVQGVVGAINGILRANGLSSSDPGVIQYRNALLQNYQITASPSWTGGLP